MAMDTLEKLVVNFDYDDLPETWQVPGATCFSPQKTLYSYQTDALRNAARALFGYYHPEIAGGVDTEAKNAADFYKSGVLLDGNFDIPMYESRADIKNRRVNPVYQILEKHIDAEHSEIPYRHLINRMCFWMATGSGKTLVMIKLIEYLHFLQKHREIPGHNILILAPSDHLIEQIKRTVSEFNLDGLHIDLVPLQEIHSQRQPRLGETVTVYYHRGDNISDERTEARIDYREYENDGKWYVLLDEAHKGDKDNSKRQAYYAVMARAGFLFNFSATFTNKEDIVATVKKYNLQEFILNGHGKNICLNAEEYTAFANQADKISDREKQIIVLKSLITLAYVSMRGDALRRKTGTADLYHKPLMLTLVNSVNTGKDTGKNDLWAFFETLQSIANGNIDDDLFVKAKTELTGSWQDSRLLFGNKEKVFEKDNLSEISDMKLADLREAVFLSREQSAMEVIHSKDKKELAFQLRNADSPFALIRIGEISGWRKNMLAGYSEGTATLREKSFFAGLEKGRITILMGSRSFFESWDSNRPNVINFINIGRDTAKKFVMQSVGRGVRIEPLPGHRRRLEFLDEEKSVLEKCGLTHKPLETLFLFATNRKEMQSVLECMESEDTDVDINLDGFEKSPLPKIGNKEMLLLVPEYKTVSKIESKPKFAMSKSTWQRFKQWLDRTSDSVLLVRDGLTVGQIAALRDVAASVTAINRVEGKDYAMLSFLQERLLSYFSLEARVFDKIRPLNQSEGDKGDIVHFRQIRVRSAHAPELREVIKQVKQGKTHKSKKEMAPLLISGEITEEQFDDIFAGKDEAEYKESVHSKPLIIKKLINHYYFPVVLGHEAADYIKHIIKIRSEVDFINDLEDEITSPQVAGWDAWMFSRIDESLDKVHIPYWDKLKNTSRQFFPDFVFWMCKGKRYRIVFVDPKGGAHTSAYHKIDGYKQWFMANGKERIFKHPGGYQVSVGLLFYNRQPNASDAYENFWTNDVTRIFENPPE